MCQCNAVSRVGGLLTAPRLSCHASHGPGPPAAPLKLGGSPEAQAGARGTEEGTEGESKRRRRRRGSPAPFLGKITGAIVHFSTSCTARPPKTDPCASRFALTPQKESLRHSGLGSPREAWERANPPKSLFRTLNLATCSHLLTSTI